MLPGNGQKAIDGDGFVGLAARLLHGLLIHRQHFLLRPSRLRHTALLFHFVNDRQELLKRQLAVLVPAPAKTGLSNE